eukprot:9642863-Alexandrium_andersonii.AAC.1
MAWSPNFRLSKESESERQRPSPAAQIRAPVAPREAGRVLRYALMPSTPGVWQDQVCGCGFACAPGAC